MNMTYRCRRCGKIYAEAMPERFVKTTFRKCPDCGSAEVSAFRAKGSYRKTKRQ